MARATTTLARCTVRLEAGSAARGITSVGTGFFYQHPTPSDPTSFVIVILTNKHVVAGCDFVRFTMSHVAPDFDVDSVPSAQDVGQQQYELRLFAPILTLHPDPTVDLCAILITPQVAGLMQTGRRIYGAFLGPHLEVSDSDRAHIQHVEPVAMVGYPRGLWDHVNNAPIVRRGCTATHPLQNYQGRSEFVIDMTCLHGSSGSPVFLFEQGMYRSGPNAVAPGDRLVLLGALWGGPHMDLEGRIEMRPVPNALAATPVVTSMMNLGYVIHASRFGELLSVVHQQLPRPTPAVT